MAHGAEIRATDASGRSAAGFADRSGLCLGSEWVIALSHVLILVLTQPDLRWLVEKLRPWLGPAPRI
ncbi:hypothetical protein ABC766_26985 [Methylobacterium fujisawaense]|uniref:hypothetical protein n=1 Tax=Methylobacterium fujisawaense TaxID=107400 RepID=UPI0031F4E5E5